MNDTQPISRLLLVYQDNHGEEVTQFATELTEAGVAINDNGDDMELVGFRVLGPPTDVDYTDNEAYQIAAARGLEAL